jgi:hypothetical protein
MLAGFKNEGYFLREIRNYERKTTRGKQAGDKKGKRKKSARKNKF